MQYRSLGRSGLKVSSVSFGAWVTFGSQLDEALATDCMKYCYDQGVNFFDNAEAYAGGQAEALMGRILKKMEWSRDSFCVSSKVYWGGERPTQRGLSKKHVTDACHAALKRLQVDYLDLYFCHRPDAHTPMEETVRAMHALIMQGKVMYWGTSEWSATQIMEAYAVARQYGLTPPTMEQPQYNMFERKRVESEYVRLYVEMGLGATTWSPLASGILTGKYEHDIPRNARLGLPQYAFLKERFLSEEGQARNKKIPALRALATEIDMSLTQMSVAWCLTNPHVSTVILGASKVEQLKETLRAVDLYPKLNHDVLKRIDAVLGNVPDPEPRY